MSKLDKPTLFFLCGKMGAGKSTESQRLSAEQNAVLISEDDWLAQLYPNQILVFDDYLHFSALLRPLVKSHVFSILKTGTNVVLDFPANTAKQRKWFVSLANDAEAYSQMTYMKASDKICLGQIAKRRVEQPARSQFDTESVFNEVSKFFEQPTELEGINTRVIDRNLR